MHAYMRAILTVLVLVSSEACGHVLTKRQSWSNFKCSQLTQIPSHQVCDGHADCHNGRDETSSVCSQITDCGVGFRCDYGACIDRTKKCNDVPDCHDASDESPTLCGKASVVSTCPKGSFRCKSGQCIDEIAACDGDANCSDESDETYELCSKIECPSFAYSCAYGACVGKTKLCNGKKDCFDGSDEFEGLCLALGHKPDLTTSKPVSVSLAPAPGKNQCVVKSIKGGTVSIAAGSVVSSRTTISLSCNPGFSLGTSQNFSECVDGTWLPPYRDCLQLCQSFRSVSMDMTCSLKSSPVPCSKPSLPGTKGELSCKKGYRDTNLGSNIVEAECSSKGVWRRQKHIRCLPYCGRELELNRQDEDEDLSNRISYGQDAHKSLTPWHAGIYQNLESKYEYTCGGTILTASLILTAGHCVLNEETQRAINTTFLKIAVGKIKLPWTSIDEGEARFDVRHIFVHDEYTGARGKYRNDIALISITGIIDITLSVQPACFSFSNAKRNNEDFGLVAGWGLTEKQKASEVLQVVELPYVDRRACRSKVSAATAPYITEDKFCAGYTNGTGVQQGDSGGGYVFLDREASTGTVAYYIYGIVSVKDRDSDTYAVFTKFDSHQVWISRIIDSEIKRLESQ